MSTLCSYTLQGSHTVMLPVGVENKLCLLELLQTSCT